MTRRTEPPSAAVPQAKQAEEVRARWAWTEPTVWTDRMLNALETGVKGGFTARGRFDLTAARRAAAPSSRR